MGKMDAVRKYRQKPEAKKKYQALNRRWYTENPQFVMYRNAKRRAKDRNLAFDLNWREITIPEVCPMLGIPLVVNQGGLLPGSPSLDRIDPNRGYTKDNVWVISHRANTAKNNLSIEEFERMLISWRNKIG